jgi:hypothetical protein
MFDHDINDDPYKQTEVKKGLNRLVALCDELGEHLFTSWSDRDRGSGDLFGLDYEDDYVVVHYDHALTKEQKTALADCIKQMVSVKKTVYSKELPEVCIVFCKVAEEDCFCFYSSEE